MATPFFCERASRCLLLIASAIAIGSCSLVVDADRQQCTMDVECQTGDPGFADAVCNQGVCEPNPTWACLSTTIAAPPQESRPARVVIQLRDLVTEQPASGITGRLCRKLDYDCLNPLQSGLVGDANGNLSVDTMVGFDGYVELRVRERMPGVYFFHPPVSGDREIPNVPMIKEMELFQFAALASRPITMGRGHVMLGAYDCLGRAAEGISFTSEQSDSMSSTFYAVMKVPSVKTTATDVSGRGGMINMKAEPITITGRLADGRVVGTVAVFVRPQAITYTTLTPMPLR